jgi:ribosomal protein S18 acetylase RimI-like enzyme
MTTIRAARDTDRPDVLDLAADSGLFDASGAALVGERFDAFVLGDESAWFIADDPGPAGVVYCAPEPLTDRCWNVLMLAVRPAAHGRGVGQALMRHIEAAFSVRGARLLLVETSGLPAFERPRRFYAGLGYREVARIPDYYAAGDDKIVFTRMLANS